MLSVASMWVMTLWLLVEATNRFFEPPKVQGWIMLLVACIGFVFNLLQIKVLHTGDGHYHLGGDDHGHDHNGHDHGHSHDHKHHDHKPHDHKHHDHKHHEHKTTEHNHDLESGVSPVGHEEMKEEKKKEDHVHGTSCSHGKDKAKEDTNRALNRVEPATDHHDHGHHAPCEPKP